MIVLENGLLNNMKYLKIERICNNITTQNIHNQINIYLRSILIYDTP